MRMDEGDLPSFNVLGEFGNEQDHTRIWHIVLSVRTNDLLRAIRPLSSTPTSSRELVPNVHVGNSSLYANEPVVEQFLIENIQVLSEITLRDFGKHQSGWNTHGTCIEQDVG